MINFKNLGLSESTLSALEKCDIVNPTPIQSGSIPLALEGRDIIGTAQTGTGKTLAFALPMIEFLIKNPDSTALVLTPTRELAGQVMASIARFMPAALKKKTALLIGGACMRQQHRALSQKPRLIVGTPGRINDHIGRGSVSLSRVGYFVLDETDRMLDMGFSIQIDAICEMLPERRQTLLFTATLPHHISRVANKYLINPESIVIKSENTAPTNIKHEFLETSEKDKFNQLIEQIDKRDGTMIVFVKTKRSADFTATSLRSMSHDAEPIHGDLRQARRERTLRRFRSGQFRILVATDVAARGLDVPHVAHVVNYDLPQCPEDYIHRIGRTGRAGASGEAIGFVTKSDRSKWSAIDRIMNPDAAKDQRRKSSRPPQKQFKGRGYKQSGRSSSSQDSQGQQQFKGRGYRQSNRDAESYGSQGQYQSRGRGYRQFNRDSESFDSKGQQEFRGRGYRQSRRDADSQGEQGQQEFKGRGYRQSNRDPESYGSQSQQQFKGRGYRHTNRGEDSRGSSDQQHFKGRGYKQSNKNAMPQKSQDQRKKFIKGPKQKSFAKHVQ